MEQLIKENQKYVKAVIKSLTGSENEDLEQEVYIKTWQNLEKYEDQGKFKQWICTITANICRDWFRSKAYKAKKSEIASEPILEKASVKPKMEEGLDRKNRQKIVLKAVYDLPKIYRDVVILAHFEDKTLNEISLKLKIPQGTVKSRLFKAKEILKTNLTFLTGEN